MPAFLTFVLAAPMASFGAIAVGERRGSWDRPARSAVLGLVGACLGIEREDDAAQAALATGYGLALLCHAPGRLLADYHTAQVPPTRRGVRYRTRAAELAAPQLNTILSRRDYRTGAWHVAALWARAPARWPLEALAEAMAEPVFTPYLGRKSCPLGLPLGPLVHDADGPAAALMHRHRTGPEVPLRDLFRLQPGEPMIARDVWDDDPADSAATRRTEFRRDQPRSRRRPWQFDLRREIIEGVPEQENRP